MPDFTPLEAPAHKAQSLPIMLPGKLIGRDTVLAQVYQQLKTNRPVLIYGAAGTGKTALAGTLASAYTELPSGVLWLPVDSSSLEELIVRVGRAYQVPEITSSDTPLGLVGAVASTLTEHRPLVVLDGNPDPQATADFVTRCAAGLPVLLTAKDRLDGPWGFSQLQNLNETAAIALLRQHAGLEEAAGLDDELDELASILDYVPLAIAIAAGTMRLAKQSPADYLAAFEKIPASGATPQLLALTVGFRSLSNALQGILLMLGATFKGQASAELLSMMSGAPPDTIQQVMTLLANNNFVERLTRHETPYYRLHDLMHGFTQTWLRGAQRLDGLQNKVRDTVVEYVKKYSSGADTAYDKLDIEMDTVMAVAEWSAEQGDRDVVNQIIVSLMHAGDFVNERGYVYELLRLRKLSSSFTTAFPAYPAAPVGAAPTVEPAAAHSPEDLMELMDEDEDEEVRVDLPRATVGVFSGLSEDEADELDESFDEDEEFEDEFEDEDEEPESATSSGLDTEQVANTLPELTRLQGELRQARQQNDTHRQIDILKRIAQLNLQQNHETEAIATYTEILNVYEAAEDTEGMLQTLDALSTLMVRTENSSAAVMHATRGINIADELDDEEMHMRLLTTLGDARQQLGESGEAVHAYQSALNIAQSLEDNQSEAMLQFKLGAAQLDNNDAEAAATTWEQALKLFRAQGKRAYEGRVLGGLGTAYAEMGRWTEAINFHTSALYIAREVKDKPEEALQLANLGDSAVQANQPGDAVLRYRQALHLAFQSGNHETIVSSIVDLVLLLVESPRHLNIAEMLINEALKHDPNDKDVTRLKDRITNEKLLAQANQVEFLPVHGVAQDYAANAYKLLEA